jgi:HEAT repeat protein
MIDAHPRAVAPAGGPVRRRVSFTAGLLVVWIVACPGVRAQQPVPQADAAVGDLAAAVDALGNLDYRTRMTASRTLRRAPAAQAAPLLAETASGHDDGYVRFRALVLLTGFNDPRTAGLMARMITEPNDRLREVAYSYFEHHPQGGDLDALLSALGREEAEFVRPALIRALAARGSDERVQQALVREVGRGQDFFRSAVIEALGDYRAGYAVPSLLSIARLEGPLQVEAALALGRIGDESALGTLAELQRTAPRIAQPAIAAAICLLGINCDAHVAYLESTVRFGIDHPEHQELLRAAARGLQALAVAGNPQAAGIVLRLGIPSDDPARARLALAMGVIALRSPAQILALIERNSDREGAVELLREGFDMLEEDFEEERFFVIVRRAYWQAPESSAAREVADLLIRKLEF